jgi:Tfp pilus assembly protein PilP
MRSAIVLALGVQLAAVPALLAQSQPAQSGQPAKAGQGAPSPNKTAAAPAKPAATSGPSKPSTAPAKPGAQPQAAAAKPAPAPGKPQASSSKPAAAAQAPKPAGNATSAAQKPTRAAAGKPAAPKSATPKPATKAVRAPKKAVERPAQTSPEAEAKVARRDPFESLVARQEAQKRTDAALPPGIHGLQVSTLRLDGVVKSQNGMIAVVSNPQARTYFLREGDQLYDGTVDKIAMDGVSFHEIGKDAFGKPVERQVNKRIYSSAGEQQ